MPLIFFTLIANLGKAVAAEFITSDEALKWVKLAMSVIDGGVELNARFEALTRKLGKRLDAGEHFGEADFDAIVTEVKGRDERWANV